MCEEKTERYFESFLFELTSAKHVKVNGVPLDISSVWITFLSGATVVSQLKHEKHFFGGTLFTTDKGASYKNVKAAAEAVCHYYKGVTHIKVDIEAKCGKLIGKCALPQAGSVTVEGDRPLPYVISSGWTYTPSANRLSLTVDVKKLSTGISAGGLKREGGDIGTTGEWPATPQLSMEYYSYALISFMKEFED